MEKKPFKYYAIRTLNTVIFRRTVSKLKRVRSILYKPNTQFRLEQVTYTGGRVIGTMPHAMWSKCMGSTLKAGCMQITREQFKALDPYIQKGE